MASMSTIDYLHVSNRDILLADSTRVALM